MNRYDLSEVRVLFANLAGIALIDDISKIANFILILVSLILILNKNLSIETKQMIIKILSLGLIKEKDKL